MKTNLNTPPVNSNNQRPALATPGEPDIQVAEAQRIGDGFPTDARRTLGACLRIMDSLVEVRYLADSVNECADEKAWKPIVPKLLEAFRMAWDAARADVEMYNFD